MTKFNPDNKPTDQLTFGDILHPAMAITDQVDADQYLDAYIVVQELADITCAIDDFAGRAHIPEPTPGMYTQYTSTVNG